MTEMVVLPEDAEIIGAVRGTLIKLLPRKTWHRWILTP